MKRTNTFKKVLGRALLGAMLLTTGFDSAQADEQTTSQRMTHHRAIDAVQFAKDVEQYRLFFLEDLLAPEDIEWFEMIRNQTATPLAMGELFNSPHEWTPLITERLIDYIRVHVSQAGGLTPCRKMAILAELHGVKTAWHGPGDVSPVGHACNVALDLASWNFGIQEAVRFNEATQEVFSGCPHVENGYMHINEAPGFGVELDEATLAATQIG